MLHSFFDRHSLRRQGSQVITLKITSARGGSPDPAHADLTIRFGRMGIFALGGTPQGHGIYSENEVGFAIRSMAVSKTALREDKLG